MNDNLLYELFSSLHQLWYCRGGSGYGGHTDNYGYAPSPPAPSSYTVSSAAVS